MTGPNLRSVEGMLDMPDCLLTYIIEGDLDAIARIGEAEMRPGLRRRIITGLARIDDDTQRRRSL